jgi:hypothetical protein
MQWLTAGNKKRVVDVSCSLVVRLRNVTLGTSIYAIGIHALHQPRPATNLSGIADQRAMPLALALYNLHLEQNWVAPAAPARLGDLVVSTSLAIVL